MAQASDDRGLTSLSPAEARLGHAFARSKVLAVACIVALAFLGWLYLALSIVGMAENGRLGVLGPGMGLLDLLAQPGAPDRLGGALIDALCRPAFGGASFAGLSLVDEMAIVFVMWCAMTLAMMLPTAGPMIVTYAELADTAARKQERAVSPLVLIAGYAAVWFAFAAIAATLQIALMRVALLDPAMAAVSPLFSGAIFVAAGAYQFSALKEACVGRCQRPFPFFFANWSRERRVIFRLGLQQGLFCLGCCWAAMLAMFAVGVMNVIWMAVIGLVMTAEKIATTMRLTHVVGAVFIAVGLAFIGSAVLAHWPAHPV